MAVHGAVRRVEVTGPARPAVAWERYADLDAWATWAPQIRRVEADGNRLAVGRSGVVVALGGVRARFVVTAVDEVALRWSWIARVGPLTLALHHGVAPDPRGSRTDLVLEGPGPVVAAYAPVTRLALLRLVAA